MRITICLVVGLAACGSAAGPAARSPGQRAADTAPALAALRASRFDEAGRRASDALALDPRNAQAAAIRALAAYVDASSAMEDELIAVVRFAERQQRVDHVRGRIAWRTFGERLDAIDRDLAVAAADPAFSLELCIACWQHDWDRDGKIDDDDRHLLEIEYDTAGHELPDGDSRRRPTFRFDVGDADWARAMIAFQRAFVDLVIAYDWTQLDKMIADRDDRTLPRIVIRLVDRDRVLRARQLVLDGLDYADRARAEYLAETDDDREWVPNPRQRSHPVPLPVDDALYATWAGVTGDVRRLVTSEQGISLHELGKVIAPELERMMPDGYLDLGAMLREPGDIAIDFSHEPHSPDEVESLLKSLLGRGYRATMPASPLLARLWRMREELERGADTFGHKLRYLLWFN